MSGGLIIRLKPHEKCLINGAVIENGDRRVSFRVRSSNVNVLRLRDAMHPDDANTPVKRLYYISQLALTGDMGEREAEDKLVSGLDSLAEALPEKFCGALIQEARVRARAQQFFQVMRHLKDLMPHEDRLLGYAEATVDPLG